jgi:hypothetical protein
MKVKFNVKEFSDTITNIVDYSLGFIEEAKRNESRLAKGVAELSIEAFYDYLDGLSRSHPGMLHHVYEWGQVGDPFGRLYELTANIGGKSVTITADFLTSESVSDNSNEPFYNKAEIMEEGIPVVIKERDAEALFFTVGSEEFFRIGPIVIANPGGSSTRGSFVQAFNDFYGNYFEDVFLSAIRFYDHFRDANEYKRFIRTAAKSKSAYTLGKGAGLSWIEKAPK